jgi:hypothetical protein
MWPVTDGFMEGLNGCKTNLKDCLLCDPLQLVRRRLSNGVKQSDMEMYVTCCLRQMVWWRSYVSLKWDFVKDYFYMALNGWCDGCLKWLWKTMFRRFIWFVASYRLIFWGFITETGRYWSAFEMWPIVEALNDCEQHMDEVYFLCGLLYIIWWRLYNHCEI